MNNIKLKVYGYFIIGLALVTWLSLIFITEGKLIITSKALLQIPNVISINVFIWFVFIKWLWKLKIFRGWLVPFPNLSGKWKGQVIPKNINPTAGKQYDPIDVDVIIRQTFLSMHVRILSEEMESNSYATSFKLDAEANEKRLCYTYLSKPKANIRDRSPIHDGTAFLTIKGEKENKLEGEYWTSRASTGEIYLQRKK